MSLNLYWRPLAKGQHDLPDALKFILRERFGNGVSFRRVFSATDFDYLRGLTDAKVVGAQDLIEAIERWDQVEVWTE